MGLFRHLLDGFKKSVEWMKWLVDDATFENMGYLMFENSGRLLGLYDELSAFLSQIRVEDSLNRMNYSNSYNFLVGITGDVIQVRM